MNVYLHIVQKTDKSGKNGHSSVVTQDRTLIILWCMYGVFCHHYKSYFFIGLALAKKTNRNYSFGFINFMLVVVNV